MAICFIYGVAKKVTGYPTPAPPTDLTSDELEYFVDPKTELAQKVMSAIQILGPEPDTSQ